MARSCVAFGILNSRSEDRNKGLVQNQPLAVLADAVEESYFVFNCDSLTWEPVVSRWPERPGDCSAWRSRLGNLGKSAPGAGYRSKFLVLYVEEPGMFASRSNLFGHIPGILTLSTGESYACLCHIQPPPMLPSYFE